MQLRTRATAGWRRVLASGLLGLLLASAPAHGSIVVPLSLAQLTDAAQVIVDGTVLDVRHVEGPSGAERMLRVRVHDTWKGEADDTVYVRVPGGRIGRLETRVTGTPRVDASERFVWFLSPSPRGGFVIVGLHQGALRTSGDSTDAVVMAPAPAATARGDVTRGWRPLAGLATDIRRLVEAGR